MNKYSVSLIRPLTMTMEVEATCEAEAMTKALKNVVGSEDILCWNTQTAQVTGAQLIAYADLDAEKLEAMLNVLRNNGFEVGEKRNYYSHTEELVGYNIVGQTPETEMKMYHNINCSVYTEGLTPENFLNEWKLEVRRYNPAQEVAETIADLDTADAAKCLRSMLEDCDAYAYHLRMVTAKMQAALLEYDKTHDA